MRGAMPSAESTTSERLGKVTLNIVIVHNIKPLIIVSSFYFYILYTSLCQCCVYIITGDYSRILNLIAPNLISLVNLEVLLPYLQQHQLITDDEESYLSNMLYSSRARAQMLLRYLKHKGDGSLQLLLCCLHLAYEHKGHKELAVKLKRQMQTTGIYCTDFCSDDCKQH